MSVDATFTVSTALPTPTAPTTSPAPSRVGGGDFLGFGVLRPFVRDKKSDWASDGGGRLVAACIGQVLGTRAASEFSQGEIPWRDEFGSWLHRLRHASNDDTTREIARVYVAEAISRWEPRANVTGVEVLSEDVPGHGEVAMAIRVWFDLASRNSPGNTTLLPGLEAVVPLV